MELIDWCQKNLVLDNPEYHVAEKMGRWTGKIQKYLHLYEVNGSTLILPFGLIDQVWARFLHNKHETLETDFATPMPLLLRGDIKLYDYQQRALDQLKISQSGILEAPCGSGKTQIGLALIKSLGQKALWITHTTDLLKQSMERAKQYFEGDFGTITDGQVHIGGDITFATVQTLAKLDLTQYAGAWNVVIVDECHRAAGTPTKVKQFYKVVSHLKARHKYGLSATLDRADGLIKSVFALLGDIKHKISNEDVGSKIIKANHVIITTQLADDLEKYVETDGTLVYAKLIDYIAADQQRNELIARQVALKPNSYHLVLSHRLSHLNTLKKILEQDFNIPCAYISGSTAKDLREDELKNVKEGKIHVLLATYSLAKEGLDIPILDTLHLATPNKNKAIVLQSVGRIERNIEGKARPEVLDYVDMNIGYCVGMLKKRKNIIRRAQ